MAATRVVVTHLVSLVDSNGQGLCTGGALLAWIDICAGLAAKSLARRPCVTASVDAVHFLSACNVGSVVIVMAMINRTFKTSMEVGVRVEEEDGTGRRRHSCSAYLTFVAVQPGGSGGTQALPKVVPTSSRYAAIHSDAAQRRAVRLAARERLRDNPAAAAQEAECRLHPVAHSAGTPTLPPALHFKATTEGRRTRIAPSLTTSHLTHIIMPQHANSVHITFGGQVMRWMEQAAFIVASRVCRGCDHLMTASIDGVTFRRPTRVGDSMYVEAQATAVFGSSVEVQLSVWGEAPEEGSTFHCGDAWATVVAVDGEGAPVGIPFEIVPETAADALRYRRAVERRAARLEVREALRREKSSRPSLDDSVYAAEESGSWQEQGQQ